MLRDILYLVYLCLCLGLGLFMSHLCDLCFIFSFIFIIINHIQGRRHRGVRGGRGCHGPPTFWHSKKKKRRIFKAETIERLSPRSKCHCFSHSRVSRIQKIFLSVNHGGRQYFSVFHGPYTLKSIMPALIQLPLNRRTCFLYIF